MSSELCQECVIRAIYKLARLKYSHMIYGYRSAYYVTYSKIIFLRIIYFYRVCCICRVHVYCLNLSTKISYEKE